MDHTEATDRLLDAAEGLFYAHGIHAVGMDAIRARSGVSLKRLYQLYPAKDALVEAYLRRRDERWRTSLESYVAANDDDPLAVFDWLREWFAEPDFRGCAFINSFGELGNPSPGVADAIRHHKAELRRFVRRLVADPDTAEQVFTLVEGATVIAAMTGDADAAPRARIAAETLLNAGRRPAATRSAARPRGAGRTS